MSITDKKRRQIEAYVRKHFRSAGNWWVDDQGIVHCTGLLTMKLAPENHKLGVQFGKIKGDFSVSKMALVSLEGCPTEVSGWFYCQNNLIEDLQGAPKAVGTMIASNPRLKSLKGMPDHVTDTLQLFHTSLTNLDHMPTTPGAINQLNITYNPHLPMLRALVAKKIHISNPESGYSYLKPVQPIQDIMNDPQWVGQGKRMMLHCALALKNAGYEGNAKW